LRTADTGILDLFNALNQNPIVGFRTITGARFQELIAVLDPRAARFGIRGTSEQLLASSPPPPARIDS
jgi:hypothetical protein